MEQSTTENNLLNFSLLWRSTTFYFRNHAAQINLLPSTLAKLVSAMYRQIAPAKKMCRQMHV
jgi:hypothetical protein